MWGIIGFGLLGLGLVSGISGIEVIPNFELGGISINWVTAACLVAVFWVIIKYGSKNKALTYSMIAGVLMIVCSTAITNYLDVRADMNRRSATYGSISYVDVYKNFTFWDIELDDVVFYKESTNIYAYQKEITKSISFKGSINKYNLLVNNAPADTTSSNGGNLYGLFKLNFYDTDENFICEIPLEIRYTFSVSKVSIDIKASVSTANYGYLVQYVYCNGLNLRLIDEQYKKI